LKLYVIIKKEREMDNTVSYEFNPICQRCGKYKYSSMYSSTAGYCKCPSEPPQQYQLGWICPSCRRAYAPWVRVCECQIPSIPTTNVAGCR
jgi:hypothetical protein